MPTPTYHHPPTSALMRVRSRTSGTRTILAVSGEVDLASASVLRSAISAVFGAGAAELLIDLSETQFMDSAGLHLLVDTQHEASRLRRRLAIVCPRGPVRRVVDITGLAGTLPLHEDVASAARCVNAAS